MDAGKFNLNFGNVGGLGANRFNKAPGPNPNQADGSKGVEEKGPRDEVNFGSFHQEVAPEVHQTEQFGDLGLIAGNAPTGRTEQTFSPSGLIDLNTIGGVDTQKFSNLGTGITALNGINSTSITTIGGMNIASANLMNPVSAVKQKTTSVFTNGIESTEFFTSSGREISNNSKVSVKMPTTSITTFGLEDNNWLTTSGRTISLS